MTDEAQPESGIRKTIYKQPAGKVPTEATEVAGIDVLNVDAQTVIMRRSGAQKITAERASLVQSGTKSVEAKSVQMDRSSAYSVSGEHAVMQSSSAALVKGKELRLVRSRALLAISERAHLENSHVLLLAGSAEGDVRATLTPVTALVFGAALGAGFAIVAALVRLIFGRR